MTEAPIIQNPVRFYMTEASVMVKLMLKGIKKIIN